MKFWSGYKGMLCGRTPMLWQREMTQATSQLDDLRRDSVWIEGWIAGAELNLCPDSLTGHCLAEVVGSAATGEDSDLREHPANNTVGGSITTPNAPHFIRGEEAGDKNWRSLPDSKTEKSKRDMLPRVHGQTAYQQRWNDLPRADNRRHPIISEKGQGSKVETARPDIFPVSSRTISAKANRDLLIRLAGVPLDLEVHSQNRHITWPTISNRSASTSIVPSESMASRQIWLKSLADTAAQSLQVTDLDQISAILLSGHQISADRAGYLELQWRTSLSGLMAPSHLLAAISRKASATSDKTDRSDHVLLKYHQTESDGKDWSGNSSITTPDHDPSDRSTEPAWELDTLSLPGHMDQEHRNLRSGQTRAVIDSGRYSNQGSERVQPTTLPGLPSRDSSHTTPRHPASVSAPEASAGHSAREGLIGSEEDTVALAAKIKRILDDEARRYGINV
jgi:hypothetical protein